MSESAEKMRVWIKVSNASQDHVVLFVLEPWGDQYEMAPGTIFDVVGEGAHGESFHIEWAEDSITVYGWAESVVAVYENGQELSGAPWPPLPSPE